MRTKRVLLAFLFLAGCSSSSNNATDAGASNDGGTIPGNDGGTNEGGVVDTDGGSVAFRAITLPDDLDATDNVGERVTGIACTAANKCVVVTSPNGEAGHIYATDGHTILNGGAALVTGDETYADQFGTVGTVQFLGVQVIGSRVVAHTDGAESAFVSATGDITQPASWTSVVTGTSATAATSFALNPQFGFGTNGTKWVMLNDGRIWEATVATPAPAASWTVTFSPQASSPIPADIETQRGADPTLCDSDPTASIAPQLTQAAYVAPDLSVIVSPAGAVNQHGNDTAGVCISVDGGHSFHHAAFTGVDDGSGPLGIGCSSKDHCVAYGGIQSTPNTAFIYVSNNASSGATSTWTKATTPTIPDDTGFRSVAFAPDGMHGYIVGNTAAQGSLLFTTTDGGATWVDSTSTIKAATGDNRLHSVYVFDATHVWIGGEKGTLIASGS